MDSDQNLQREKIIFHPHEAFNKTTRYFVSMMLFSSVSFSKFKRAILEGRKKLFYGLVRSLQEKNCARGLEYDPCLVPKTSIGHSFFLYSPPPPRIHNSCYKNVIKTSKLHFLSSPKWQNKMQPMISEYKAMRVVQLVLATPLYPLALLRLNAIKSILASKSVRIP